MISLIVEPSSRNSALEPGAHGIVVSREDEEMKIAHLEAVGRAVKSPAA